MTVLLRILCGVAERYCGVYRAFTGYEIGGSRGGSGRWSVRGLRGVWTGDRAGGAGGGDFDIGNSWGQIRCAGDGGRQRVKERQFGVEFSYRNQRGVCHLVACR